MFEEPRNHKLELVAVALFATLTGVVVGQTIDSSGAPPKTVTVTVPAAVAPEIGCFAPTEDSLIDDPTCDYRDGYWVHVAGR